MRPSLAKASLWTGLAALLVSPCLAQTVPEPGTDRRLQGDDVIVLPRFQRHFNYCLDRCLRDRFCRAWTYSDMNFKTTCSIGNTLRDPVPSSCCISGSVE